MKDLNEWMQSLEYMPEFMRDFHDQKAVFKDMHRRYINSDTQPREGTPNWVEGHIYVTDWFLWYMASRGYTLQKSRVKTEFLEMTHNEVDKQDAESIAKIFRL